MLTKMAAICTPFGVCRLFYTASGDVLSVETTHAHKKRSEFAWSDFHCKGPHVDKGKPDKLQLWNWDAFDMEVSAHLRGIAIESSQT